VQVPLIFLPLLMVGAMMCTSRDDDDDGDGDDDDDDANDNVDETNDT